MLKAKQLDKRNAVKERDEHVYKTVSRWARTLVRLAGGRIKVVGEENLPVDEAVVFISNHQGNFDIPILMGYINKPKAFIAKIETRKLPLVSTWMKHMKCVFMDRNDIRQSVQAINEGVDLLKQGYSMVIFPEGTRSKGETMGEFKQGSFKLATKAGVPIVPVAIKGSYKMMEEKGFIRPASVEVIISKPISTEGLTREELQQLPDRVKEIISGLVVSQ
jgi:1-acyl-sn-glycerol-3-phosphate acyltransferase